MAAPGMLTRAYQVSRNAPVVPRPMAPAPMTAPSNRNPFQPPTPGQAPGPTTGGSAPRNPFQPPVPGGGTSSGTNAAPAPKPYSPYYVPQPGPTPVSSTSGYYDSPWNAQQGFTNDVITNPAGWRQYGPLNTTRPEAAGQDWLTYLMADPYNRMISNAGEVSAMDEANRAFGGAANRANAAALRAGAGQSGVAQGQSAALQLARGAELAKAARDWEQYKINKGDQRLQSLWLPYTSMANQVRSGVNANMQNQSQGSNLSDWTNMALGLYKMFGGGLTSTGIGIGEDIAGGGGDMGGGGFMGSGAGGYM